MKPFKFVMATLTAVLALSVYAVQLRKECEDKSAVQCLGEVVTWVASSLTDGWGRPEPIEDPIHEEVPDEEQPVEAGGDSSAFGESFQEDSEVAPESGSHDKPLR